MAELKNEMSWSRTRMSTLHACKRQYYYQYYLKWDGWNWNAPQRRKVAYRLSKMSNLNMLAGLAVHDTIKVLLDQLWKEGGITEPDASLYARKNILTRVWRDAEKEQWKDSPKRFPPMFELYYGQPVSTERLKSVGAKVARCVQNFEESELFADLKQDDASRWLAVDPTFQDRQNLRVDGYTIWAMPDFARKTEDGLCEIWDWKTGKVNPADQVQLLSYALYARDCWGFAPEQIRLYGFYLDPESGPPLVKEYPCSAQALDETVDAIRNDFQVMHDHLDDVTENTPKSEEHFNQIEPSSTCGYCFFKELCDR
jgi:hypothetical protein